VAQQAAVHRLEQLTDFEKSPPFDGEITGASSMSAASSPPMPQAGALVLDRPTDVLRVQSLCRRRLFRVRQGDHATVTVPEIVNRTFDGTVARIAGARHWQRTLLTEVDVDNKSGELAAGLILLSVCNSGLEPVVRVRRKP